MKKNIILLLLLIGVSLRSAAQHTGTIAGRVSDEKHQPVTNAVVRAYLGNIEKGGAVTDVEGNYTIGPLDTGRYDVKVTYLGYKDNITTGVIVHPGTITGINASLEVSKTILKDEIIIAYKVPLVDKYGGSGKTRAAEQIEKMPSREYNSAVAASPGVYQDSRGAGVQYTKDEALRGAPRYYDPSEESYKKNPENDFMTVKSSPLSTMSVDVDRASYSNIRRFINEGQRPPVDAVRVEEMINYFNYNYPQPQGDAPIAIQTELTSCPWQKDHKLLHVGMQARKIDMDKLPPSNLVFLIDVSGSMDEPLKLPLLISGLKLLVNNLRAKDKVSIVVYAGNAGLVLPPTGGDHKQTIIDALEKLQAGGSTAGGAGIKLAYEIAAKNFIKGGNNRVLLATDGDFNVGVSSDNELEDLITKEREKGVFLTCLGFGTDNYKDAKMELLADKGNGNYDYIDNIQEAQKTLVSEFGGTLFTVAKDVKAQIEFNPAKVQAYRLVGYENRLLNTEDFKDDKKDAGDMGSGHTVTILYEIIPAGIKSNEVRATNDLKYQQPTSTISGSSNELATIKFRYKKPDGDKSRELVHTIADRTCDLKDATENSRFSSSVAMFGMLLRNSKYKGSSSYENVLSMANKSRSADEDGYRAEFIRLVHAEDDHEKKTSAR